MSSLAARWTCKPYSVAAADRIARDVGLSPAVASILARRGCATPEEGRSFLAAGERHDPRLMRGMDAACDLVLSHVRRGSRIVVHGDYDVDGVSSTAILVEALRAMGADPSWHLPARLEGYGLSEATVERLLAEGTGLLVTADCGITSTAEVEAARRGGMDVLVTDHHRPGERLPACPVLHPGLEPYPFAGLCAAGVAHKLSEALRARAGLDPAEAERELDLVGLATVCDLVPLRGENRRLAREGLRALARSGRPGLRALMGIAGLEPGDVDERAVGFRLGPRLNAAGRLRRADAALELLLTDDAGRAAEVADELDLLNHERRDVETRILFAAEKARAEQDGAPAYVLAGEGWHPGVAGIVASRMTERYHRPCLVVSLDAGTEAGRGSGRSIPAFDLHAGLAACSRHLRRFGGHRAAAGFEIDPERLDDFRRDFVRHAAATLSPDDLVPVQEVDAVVPAGALGLPLAEELRRLAPFGHGNPEPTLLVPASRVTDVRPMGTDGQHARFRLAGAGSRAEAVAFRASPALVARDGAEPCNAAVRLELNEWNGRVQARVTLSALCPPEQGACVDPCAPERFWAALDRELHVELDLPEPTPLVGLASNGSGRTFSDRRGEGIAGVTGELLSSGEPVLVVCADAARRRASLAAVVAGLAAPGAAAEASPAGGAVGFPPGSATAPRRGLPVVSWEALAADPDLARPFPHLLAIDPPPGRSALRLAPAAPVAAAAERSFCHLAWGPAEVEFARAVAREALDLRGALVEVYRALRDAGGAGGEELERLLAGAGPFTRPAAVCGRLLRVLIELGLVALDRTGVEGAVACRVLEAARTDLDRSPAHRAYRRRLEEIERYLSEEAARWSAPATAARASAAPPATPAAGVPASGIAPAAAAPATARG